MYSTDGMTVTAVNQSTDGMTVTAVNQSTDGMTVTAVNQSTQRKSCPVPLSPPQISHELTWD